MAEKEPTRRRRKRKSDEPQNTGNERISKITGKPVGKPRGIPFKTIPFPKREDMSIDENSEANVPAPVIQTWQQTNFRPDLGPTRQAPTTADTGGRKPPGFTHRTPENRQHILELFATGATWRQICRVIGMSQSTLRLWLIRDPSFMDDYRKAKELATDFLLDEIQDMATDLEDEGQMQEAVDAETGNIVMVDPNYERLKALAATNRTILAAKQLALEKRNPKKFGNLLKLGGDGENPLQVVVTKYGEQTHTSDDADAEQ